ncbi:MAG: hypothetical protein ACLQVK_13600 [Acidimicrobiales bacterium]
MSKATTRSGAVLAVLAVLSSLVTACGGVPAHNGVARLGNAKTTADPAECRRLGLLRPVRAHGGTVAEVRGVHALPWA